MSDDINLNNRVNQVTGSIDWLTFAEAGLPVQPELYQIINLDGNRATDGGHVRNLFGIRLGKVPNPDTLEIYEYIPDSDSDDFDSDTETGAQYTKMPQGEWPPATGEFATIGNGDIVYFHPSRVGQFVAVLPTYTFKSTPLTYGRIAEAVAASIGTEVQDAVDAAIAAIVFPYSPDSPRGFDMANNVSDATNDIDIAAGTCRDSTNTVNINGSAMTKRLDASWAAGTGNGGRFGAAAIANTTYFVFAIYKDSDGTVDYGFDTDLSAANRPVGYTYYRRIGVILRVSGAIVAGKWYNSNRRFDLSVPVNNYNTTPANTNAILTALTAPVGLQTIGRCSVSSTEDESGDNAIYGLITSPDQADTTPSTTLFNFKASNNGGSQTQGQGSYSTVLDTSARIRHRWVFSVGITVSITSFGWDDFNL